MFTLKPGWTKAKLRRKIMAANNGNLARMHEHSGSCTYEDYVGNCCFIGALLPKTHKLRREHSSANIMSVASKISKYLPFTRLVANKALQSAHDMAGHKSAGNTYAALDQFLDTYVREPKSKRAKS